MNDQHQGSSNTLSIPNELWVVIDPSDSESVYSALYEEACHEHINEAIDEDIDGAASWVVRRFVLAPEPEVTSDDGKYIQILSRLRKLDSDAIPASEYDNALRAAIRALKGRASQQAPGNAACQCSHR